MDLKDHRASTINKVMNLTEEWIKNNHHNQSVRFLYPGGVIGTLAAVNQIIAKSLPENILQISVITFLCVVVSYASVLSGFLLFLPLALGVLITFGVFGLLGITLTIETLPIASLGIGVGVDYGLYVVSRMRDEIINGANHQVDDAILKSLVTSGKAVFFSVSIVAIGVFAWAFSDIKLQAKLGLALGSLIVLNGLGALIILPVLIRMIRPAFIFKPKTKNGG
jgi:predicted RND superfamily exporter protein